MIVMIYTQHRLSTLKRAPRCSLLSCNAAIPTTFLCTNPFPKTANPTVPSLPHDSHPLHAPLFTLYPLINLLYPLPYLPDLILYLLLKQFIYLPYQLLLVRRDRVLLLHHLLMIQH